ncbi:helix-turn-helix DNA binding domain protein [Arthrobacter phage Hirko]|nr:helix-turn-helix DNA binding domain protein [Arthrobacter phage Hirko]
MPPKVTPDTIESQARTVAALELRARGMTYQEIADTPYDDGPGGTMYGGDRHNARRAIVAAYEATIKEPAEEVRQLEIQRLDMMLLGLASKGLFEGDVHAVKAGIALMARRAKLLGLDAPTEINQRGGGNVQLIVDPAAARVGMDVATMEVVETDD